MSDIYTLRSDLNRARAEIEGLSRKIAENRLKQEQSFQREMDDLRNKTRVAIDARDSVLVRQYEARLSELERKAFDELHEFKFREDMEYRKLERTLKEAEGDWEKKSEELEKLIDDLKRKTTEEGRVASKEALDLIRETEQVFFEVDKKPHEFFLPDRLSIFGSAISDAKNLHGVGMNEAAAAVSISAQSGIKKIDFEVEDLRGEWEQAFNALKGIVRDLSEQIGKEIEEWAEYVGMASGGDLNEDEKRRLTVEINYWSKGEFGELSEAVCGYASRISSAEEMGIGDYLKSDADRWILPELLADIVRAGEINCATSRARAMYRERYEASCLRSEWANAIIDYSTEEKNFVLIEDGAGYKHATEEVLKTECFAEYVFQTYGAKGSEEDSREWVEFSLENDEGTRVFVYIVPHEDDENLAITNSVLLYINHAGAADERFSCAVRDNILEALGAQNENIEVVLVDDLTAIIYDAEGLFFEAAKKLEVKVGYSNKK